LLHTTTASLAQDRYRALGRGSLSAGVGCFTAGQMSWIGWIATLFSAPMIREGRDERRRRPARTGHPGRHQRGRTGSRRIAAPTPPPARAAERPQMAEGDFEWIPFPTRRHGIAKWLPTSERLLRPVNLRPVSRVYAVTDCLEDRSQGQWQIAEEPLPCFGRLTVEHDAAQGESPPGVCPHERRPV